jgi:acyl-CoA synthetase (AMP-forming)/AMP-acid ligase II
VSKQFVQNVALLFEDQSYTYGELNHAANRFAFLRVSCAWCEKLARHNPTLFFLFPRRVANWGREDAQLKAGDVVALFMQNRPEFFITWLGMAKVPTLLAEHTHTRTHAHTHTRTHAHAHTTWHPLNS